MGTEISKEKKRRGNKKTQQKKEDLTKDYYPPSPVNDPTFKQDPLPHYTQKGKLALDPNYYPKGYIPKEKEEALLLVNNSINPSGKNTPEDPMTEEEEMKKKRMEEIQ